MVLGGDSQEGIDSLPEPSLILLPQQIVQEHSHRVHADALRPAQLQVNPFGVERVGLPHLKLVDRGGWGVVGADQPGLFFIPGVGTRGGPTAGRLRDRSPGEDAGGQTGHEAEMGE